MKLNGCIKGQGIRLVAETMQIAYYPGCTLHASSELYYTQCKKVF